MRRTLLVGVELLSWVNWGQQRPTGEVGSQGAKPAFILDSAGELRMLGPGSATWTPTKENTSSLFYLLCGEVGFYFPPSLDLLLKRWKFSSAQTWPSPLTAMTLHPSCSSPCPPGMKECLSKYPWLWMLSAHWLCPGCQSFRDSSLELRQPEATFLH